MNVYLFMLKAILYLCAYGADSSAPESAVQRNLRVEPSPEERELILSKGAAEELKRAQEAASKPSTDASSAGATELDSVSDANAAEVKPTRFNCPTIKPSESNLHLEGNKINEGRTMTKQACEDECYKFDKPLCSGFTFSIKSTTNPPAIPSSTDSGICQFYKDLAYDDIPGEHTDIFCRSKRCPYDVAVSKECACLAENRKENGDETPNECALNLICRKDGTCGMRMVCSDRLCKSVYANASAWALCDTANPADQGTCKATVKYENGCSTGEKGNYCSALKILDGECKCRDNKDAVAARIWSSTQQCSYNSVVATIHDVCFCMPKGVQTEGGIAADKLCTAGQVCKDDGVCVCSEGQSKVFDAITSALMCFPIGTRMAIACCDSKGVSQLQSAPSAEGDTDCFETASLYKASRACLDLPDSKTLCNSDQIKMVKGSGAELCRKGAQGKPLPFWVIPAEKCTENKVTEHVCYCEKTFDICTNGEICQLGGCIASCPENKDKTSKYCGCLGADGKVNICTMGQICDPGLSKCEGDGFHALPKGLCFSPVAATEPTTGPAPVPGAECIHPPYSQTLFHGPTQCAESCIADDKCECYGFVAFTAKGAHACRRFYQKLDLSRIKHDEECDHKDPTLYSLSSERVCPDAKVSEIFYDKCHCGAQTCTRGMRCDQASGKCLFKCLCSAKKEPAWWSAPPECQSHNNLQCSTCGGLLLLADDGLCKAGPNELCFAPETVNPDGVKTEAVAQVPCMHERLCIVKDPGPDAAGGNVNCTYGTEACICEPIVAAAMRSSEDNRVETGKACGGNPNLPCRAKGDTCVKKEVDDGKEACTDQLALDACFCRGSRRWLMVLLLCVGSVLLLVIGFFAFKFFRGSRSGGVAGGQDPEVGSLSHETTLSGEGASESATEI